MYTHLQEPFWAASLLPLAAAAVVGRLQQQLQHACLPAACTVCAADQQVASLKLLALCHLVR